MSDIDLTGNGGGGISPLMFPGLAQMYALDPRRALASSMMNMGQQELSQPTLSPGAALAKALTIGLGGMANANLAKDYGFGGNGFGGGAGIGGIDTSGMAAQADKILGPTNAESLALHSADPMVRLQAIMGFPSVLNQAASGRPLALQPGSQAVNPVTGQPIAQSTAPLTLVAKAQADLAAIQAKNPNDPSIPALQAQIAKLNQTSGYNIGPGGTTTAAPGGPADPAQVARLESAKEWAAVPPAVAQAGGVATAQMGPKILENLSETSRYPNKFGPNESIESGLNLLPPDVQHAILAAARTHGGTGGTPSESGTSGGPPEPGGAAPPASTVAAPGTPVSAPIAAPRPAAPIVPGAAGAAGGAGVPAGGPAVRSPASFSLRTLMSGSPDLPPPPRANPFPTQPIHNPDGSVSSPYTTSTTGLQNEANKDYDEAGDRFQAAQTVQQRLAMIDQAIEQLNQSGWSSTGTGAEAKMSALRGVNSFLTSIGSSPVADPNKISNWEDLVKETGNLGLDRSRSLGSREAQQIVNLSIGLNPGQQNTYLGAKRIEASMAAAAQRDVDYYNFAKSYVDQNHTAFGADAAFNKLRPPALYASRAVAATIPTPAIAMLQSRPDLAAQFDQKYGPGASAFVLTGKPISGTQAQ